MHPLFLPRLVNGPFEDPALFIRSDCTVRPQQTFPAWRPATF